MRPDDEKEMLDRLRRIETRLTSFLHSQGVNTNSAMPVFSGNCVTIPSMACSLKDILGAIPEGYGMSINVIHADEHVATLYMVPVL